MSNLENLIDKIIKDSQEQAEQILKNAKAQAESIRKNTEAELDEERKKVITDAESAAETAAEQIIINQRFEIRNNSLQAKQKTIDHVFDIALEKLNNLTKEEFLSFLEKSILDLSADGEEIILPSKYQFGNIDWLNDFLKKNNQKGNLKLYKGERDINGGFILLKDGIEQNSTFEALLQFHRYELENAVIDTLFEKEGSAIEVS